MIIVVIMVVIIMMKCFGTQAFKIGDYKCTLCPMYTECKRVFGTPSSNIWASSPGLK